MAGRTQVLAAAAFGVLMTAAAATPPVAAAPLVPGGAIVPVTELEPGSGATLLDSISESFATFTGTGTLHSQVYAADSTNPFGADKLTFTYRIENNDAARRGNKSPSASSTRPSAPARSRRGGPPRC